MELTIDEINNLANNNEILLKINEELTKAFERIQDMIELYNDCYEGTPDECINEIKTILDEVKDELHN